MESTQHSDLLLLHLNSARHSALMLWGSSRVLPVSCGSWGNTTGATKWQTIGQTRPGLHIQVTHGSVQTTH